MKMIIKWLFVVMCFISIISKIDAAKKIITTESTLEQAESNFKLSEALYKKSINDYKKIHEEYLSCFEANLSPFVRNYYLAKNKNPDEFIQIKDNVDLQSLKGLYLKNKELYNKYKEIEKDTIEEYEKLKKLRSLDKTHITTQESKMKFNRSTDSENTTDLENTIKSEASTQADDIGTSGLGIELIVAPVEPEVVIILNGSQLKSLGDWTWLYVACPNTKNGARAYIAKIFEGQKRLIQNNKGITHFEKYYRIGELNNTETMVKRNLLFNVPFGKELYEKAQTMLNNYYDTKKRERIDAKTTTQSTLPSTNVAKFTKFLRKKS